MIQATLLSVGLTLPSRGGRARGAGRQFYEAEVARQDRDAPPLKEDLQALKEMREQALRSCPG